MYIQETKIFRKPTVLVDTEAVSSPKVPSPNQESVIPSQVDKNYQVIDGTTIYDSPPEVITPTPTVAPSVARTTVAHIDKEDVHGKFLCIYYLGQVSLIGLRKLRAYFTQVSRL